MVGRGDAKHRSGAVDRGKAMLRFACLALVAGSLLPFTARAATPPAAPQGFGFCTVTDSSSAQAKIWASPVFPLTHAPTDPTGFQRSQELAGEFLAHVVTLGGDGTKSCVVLATQAEAATFREEQRATWDKRMYFIKVSDWREVVWSPAAGSPATTPPAQLTRYFYCYHIDTDVPGDLSHTVATTVFARTIAGDNPMALYDLAALYTRQFQQQVRARGLPEQGDCLPFDTQAEADYQQRQILKHFKGFNMTYDQIPWTPGEVAMVPVAVTAAVATPPTSVQTPAKPTSLVMPAVIAADTPVEGPYCVAFVTRSKEPLRLHMPVWQLPVSQSSPAAMSASVSQLITAVIQAHPGKWAAFPPVVCHDNSGEFGNEAFCFSTTYKHFGGSQMAAQFCNHSKDMIEQRWANMVQANGGSTHVFPWPPAP